MFKKLVQMGIQKMIGKGKVSPTIKSVKPFTEKKADQFAGIKSKTPEDRANVIRKRESIKRMDQLDNLKKKREEGIKAGKEMKRMVDTKRAKNVGGTIFSKSIRETKMAMSDAQLMHAERMAKGEEAYQGKLLEARQSDWKDEAVLIILSLPVLVLAYAVISDDPTAMDKVKLFFEMFSQLPSWFTNLWILVVASIYGIKGTQIFRNGGKK